jgi:hypothetical protein
LFNEYKSNRKKGYKTKEDEKRLFNE